ncbi:hypothetical protein PMAYCL1PPCAC_22676, partial [Pristionchus mayeri]
VDSISEELRPRFVHCFSEGGLALWTGKPSFVQPVSRSVAARGMLRRSARRSGQAPPEEAPVAVSPPKRGRGG